MPGLLQPYCFYSKAKCCIDFDQGTHLGATPEQEVEMVVQNRNNA